MEPYFWFEAQSGIISHVKPKAPSNYHRYKLPLTCLARVKLARDAATVTPAGLVYDSDFLVWLKQRDRHERGF